MASFPSFLLSSSTARLRRLCHQMSILIVCASFRASMGIVRRRFACRLLKMKRWMRKRTQLIQAFQRGSRTTRIDACFGRACLSSTSVRRSARYPARGELIYPFRESGYDSADAAENSKIEEAAAAGRTTNYGCIGTFNGLDAIPWQRVPNGYVVPGRCLCDNWLMNEIADTVLEAMPMIAQVRRSNAQQLPPFIHHLSVLANTKSYRLV